MAEVLVCPEQVNQPPVCRDVLEALAVHGAGQRQSGVEADELTPEEFDQIGVGGVHLRRGVTLEVPPAQMHRQEQPGIDRIGVEVDDLFWPRFG